MNRNGATMITTFFLSTFLLVQVSVKANLYVYFQDDFESGDLSSPSADLGSPSWTASGTNTALTISVQDSQVLSGNYSALLSDQSTSGRLTLLGQFSSTPGDALVEIAFSVRHENIGTVSTDLRLDNNTTPIAWLRWLGSSSSLQYREQGTGDYISLSSWTTNQNYEVRVLIDEANNRYDVWVDAVRVGQDIATYNSAASGVNRFRFGSNQFNAHTADIYLDDVKIETIPEPSAMALLGLGTVMLALLRRRFVARA